VRLVPVERSDRGSPFVEDGEATDFADRVSEPISRRIDDN
jgi:hypothetical protein